MKPLFYACAFLATSVVADSQTTLADIQAISDGLNVLDQSVQQLTQSGLAGISFALQIQQNTVVLNRNITRGTNNAKASAPYGEPGSFQISSAVLALAPKINNTLKDVESKKSNFAQFSPLVLASLYALKKSNDAFGAAVVAKLSALEAGLSPAVLQGIDSAFNHAIQTYGGQIIAVVVVDVAVAVAVINRSPGNQCTIADSSKLIMRFTHLAAALAAVASVSANLVVKRDAQTVLSDISSISSSAKQVNQTVSNFQGDTGTALVINSESSDLANKISKATKDVQASSMFSNTDAANIVNAITALEPVVYDTLNTLIRKKQQFATVVLGTSADALVKSDLVTLKNNTDAFSTAVTSKLPSILARLAPFLVSDIDYHYVQAINAYST